MAAIGLQTLEESVGKTVLWAGEFKSEDFVIVFTDSTYVRIRSENGYYGDYSVDCSPFEIYQMMNDAGVRSHLVTQDELGAYQYKEAERVRLAAEAKKRSDEVREREMYEALKRKFEGGA